MVIGRNVHTLREQWVCICCCAQYGGVSIINIMQVQYLESCEIVPGSDTIYKRQVIRILMYSCWKECYDEN